MKNIDLIKQIKDNSIIPDYYKTGKFDIIDFCNEYKLGFCEGNIIKYICRYGKKDPNTKLEDLKKAKEYLERLIKSVNI